MTLMEINTKNIRVIPRRILFRLHREVHVEYDRAKNKKFTEEYLHFIWAVHKIISAELVRRGHGHRTRLELQNENFLVKLFRKFQKRKEKE